MRDDYSDIIDLPHHQSETRKHMSLHDRAAQFAPFAALTGYSEAIKETGRLTDKAPDMSEQAKADLDEKLEILRRLLPERPKVTVSFFTEDQRKSGGSYQKMKGKVKRIDEVMRSIILEEGCQIQIDKVTELRFENL
ncbi:MAG: hypothetical protein IKT01_00775 [Eubacteriaceae bacterium]|nr:hypothetical protein [Eubacteriaceae bacterium]